MPHDFWKWIKRIYLLIEEDTFCVDVDDVDDDDNDDNICLTVNREDKKE